MNGFDDIIFKNRNKDYGAFHLRRIYPPVLIFSGTLTLVVFIFLMLLWGNGFDHPVNRSDEISFVYNINDTSLNKYPDRIKNVPPQGGLIHVPNYIPVVDDTIPNNDTLKNNNEGNGRDSTGNGSSNGNGSGDGPVFYSVQEPPSFPGGDIERIRFLQRNIILPPEARQKKIHGKVYVAFIIEKDGSVSNVGLLHGIGYGCDEEALRVVRSMPAWKPGRQNGQAVRVYIRWPIVF